MIESLHLIRAFAAILVALFHLHVFSGLAIIKNGYLFVDLFFALSGYLIYRISEIKKVATPRGVLNFLLRRIGRVYPALIFSMLLYTLFNNLNIFVKSADSFKPATPTLIDILISSTFLSSVGCIDHLILTTNYVSWSVGVEIICYLLFSLICLISTNEKILFSISVTLATIGLVSSFIGGVFIHNCAQDFKCMDLTYDFGWSRGIYSFFMGGAFQIISTNKFFKRRLIIPTLASLVLIFAFFETIKYYPMIAFFLPILFAACIAFAANINLNIKSHQLKILYLGDISYSIYLCHPLVLIFHETWRYHFQNEIFQMSLYLIITIGLAHMMFICVESPSRKFFNELARKTSPHTY